MRFFLYVTYTVCVVTSFTFGSLGPWALGGKWWSNKCMDENVDGLSGKYDIEDNCAAMHAV